MDSIGPGLADDAPAQDIASDDSAHVTVDEQALAEAIGGMPDSLPPTSQVRIGGKGWTEIKRFGKNKQRAYAYFRWREGKTKRSQYIGIAA